MLRKGPRPNSKSARSRAGHPNRFRPALEELEGRWLPSQTGLAAPVADPNPVVAQASASPALIKPQTQPSVSPMDGQGGGHLIINGQPMYTTPANYQDYIQYLLVDPNTGKVDPLRQQIFNAMNNNPTYTFNFLTLAGAQENFTMRVTAVRFMNAIRTGQVDFGYFQNPGTPSQAGSGSWQKIPDGTSDSTYWKAFSSIPGISADQAIQDIVNNTFRGDCLGAVEISLLEAADQTIGAARFNEEHPEGLQEIGLNGNDPNMSIWTNVRANYGQSPGAIQTQSMVPGDWVYMRNDPNYGTLAPGGRWNGENALYMGNDPTTGAPLFYGMGLQDPNTGQFVPVTEAQLKAELQAGFQNDTGQAANPSQIYWTLLAQPTVGSLPSTPPSPAPAPTPPVPAAPPSGSSPISSAPSNPSPPAPGGVGQLIAYIDQIIAQFEAEIQQLVNTEIAMEQQMLSAWSRMLGSGSRLA
jgi:hypothetical protein